MTYQADEDFTDAALNDAMALFCYGDPRPFAHALEHIEYAADMLDSQVDYSFLFFEPM